MQTETQTYIIPASINRYLPEFQQEGVDFLCRAITNGKGGILGDDMGCVRYYCWPFLF
jgi:SNF2 family DNA or RNA helicase